MTEQKNEGDAVMAMDISIEASKKADYYDEQEKMGAQR